MDLSEPKNKMDLWIYPLEDGSFRLFNFGKKGWGPLRCMGLDTLFIQTIDNIQVEID